GSKSFNEHLAPLARYLEHKVGQPWNEVFAEICTHLNRNSVVQDHVRDHVEDMVVTNVVLVDGVPCSPIAKRFFGIPAGAPLVSSRYWHRFYVCPLSGLLKRVPRDLSKRQRREQKKRQVQQQARLRYNLSKNQQCRRIDGQWYLLTFKPFPEHPELA